MTEFWAKHRNRSWTGCTNLGYGFTRLVKSGDSWQRNWKFHRRSEASIHLGGLCQKMNSSQISEKSNSFQSELRVVEAILMIAKEPLSARRLSALAGLEDATYARSLARELNESYDSNGHAFRIEEVAGGMQLLTRPQFATWLRRLEHVPGEELLSQGMLETLAIVAYRQPSLRAEIESIRGVVCDEVLRQLMQRDLVRICGRHEDLGRPYLYGTTKRFLQLFGLQSLDSLPRATKIREAEFEIGARLPVNLRG